MWNELIRGTAIRQGQQAAMVLEVYAVVEYSPALNVSSSIFPDVMLL